MGHTGKISREILTGDCQADTEPDEIAVLPSLEWLSIGDFIWFNLIAIERMKQKSIPTCHRQIQLSFLLSLFHLLTYCLTPSFCLPPREHRHTQIYSKIHRYRNTDMAHLTYMYLGWLPTQGNVYTDLHTQPHMLTVPYTHMVTVTHMDTHMKSCAHSSPTLVVTHMAVVSPT